MANLKLPANLKDKKTMATVAGTTLLFLALPLTVFVTLQQRDFRGNAATAPAFEFVTREGNKLILSGNEFKFIGVNREGLASSLFYRFPNLVPIGDTQPEIDSFLDNTFTKLKENNINVVRFFAFQSYVPVDATTKLGDFSAIDNVINRAKAHGIRLIPVLENQFHWSTQEWRVPKGSKDSTWYKDGYKIPNGSYKLSYSDYVQQIVGRYIDEPTILMWQLVSEASLEQNPTYPTALKDFTLDMANKIKNVDPNNDPNRHIPLVSMGVSGTGQPGTEGTDYRELHSIPSIDVVTAHDYNYPEEPLPGSLESPRSHVEFELYAQDSETPATPTTPYKKPNWYTVVHRQVTLGKWVTLYGNIPSTIATLPITKVAINIKVDGMPAWTGPIYFDNITIGTTSYDFENGLAGWAREGLSSEPTLKISNAITDKFSLGSLEVDINNNRTSNTRLFPVTLPANLPGSQFKIRVYVPSTAPVSSKNTMYSDLLDAKSLVKPFFFGEAGIYTRRPNETNPNLLCDNSDYCYLKQDRADLFDAKIGAAFANGASGYIVWYWDNSSVANTKLGTSCTFFGPYCFDENDPLATTLKRNADLINIQPPSPPTGLNTTQIGYRKLGLSWTASTANIPGAVTYEVYRNSTKVGVATGTNYLDSSLNPATAYSYFVKAKDAAGNLSAASTTLNVTTRKLGDVNGDGSVNQIDLEIFKIKWKLVDESADFNGDGIVTIVDLSMLLTRWESTTAPVF